MSPRTCGSATTSGAKSSRGCGRTSALPTRGPATRRAHRSSAGSIWSSCLPASPLTSPSGTSAASTYEVQPPAPDLTAEARSSGGGAAESYGEEQGEVHRDYCEGDEHRGRVQRLPCEYQGLDGCWKALGDC